MGRRAQPVARLISGTCGKRLVSGDGAAQNRPSRLPAERAGTTVPPAIIASISGDGKAVVTRTLVDVGVKADRTLELWAIPGSGSPRSLGLIAASGASVVKQSKLPPGTAALAVSLEPTGGSTTGVPTGPVLYVGKLAL
eukprot:gene45846-62091_t